jgi:hypothetical protein
MEEKIRDRSCIRASSGWVWCFLRYYESMALEYGVFSSTCWYTSIVLDSYLFAFMRVRRQCSTLPSNSGTKTEFTLCHDEGSPQSYPRFRDPSDGTVTWSSRFWSPPHIPCPNLGFGYDSPQRHTCGEISIFRRDVEMSCGDTYQRGSFSVITCPLILRLFGPTMIMDNSSPPCHVPVYQ